MELQECDIKYENSSVVDQVGRVFHYDDRIFRAINGAYHDIVKRTINLPNREKLFNLGLIATWESHFTLNNNPLVIEHQKIPFITIRGEWCAEALREAALCILKINLELLHFNLCLKDAHPWNIQFQGVKPYFIDWGSISSVENLNWTEWCKNLVGIS